MIENVHTFAAIRGVQAGREHYVTMIPLRAIPKLFLFDDPGLPAELRSQRTMNKSRVPEISRYLTENPRDYTLPALTASIDGKVRFEPIAESGPSRVIGRLVIPMASRFLINDGQHRRAAIESALRERPELGDESVSVVFFNDAGLRRSQQMFADLNHNSVRPARSLSVLYDHRDPLAQLTREVVGRVAVFKLLTDTERTSVPGRANKLFALNGLYRAMRHLLGGRTPSATETDSAVLYWTGVAQRIPEWQLAAANEVGCADLRRGFVNAHGVALEALGIAGAGLLASPRPGWESALDGLTGLNWSRSNTALWEGVAMVEGRVSKAHTHVTRTADLLKRRFACPTPGGRTVPGRAGRGRKRAA